MTIAPPTARKLDWDSAFFGVPIGQAQAETRADVEAIEAWADLAGIRCVYLLVAADNFDATRAAEARGFFLAGVRMTWSRLDPVDEPAARRRQG